MATILISMMEVKICSKSFILLLQKSAIRSGPHAFLPLCKAVCGQLSNSGISEGVAAIYDRGGASQVMMANAAQTAEWK